MSSNPLQPFYTLTPDTVAEAVESIGFWTDGRIMALNSYENRVYQVGIEESLPLIAKFYRPNRWTDAQILEEHQLMHSLVDADLSVVPAMEKDGKTLFQYGNFRFALFERRGGRAPELDDLDHLHQLGQTLGRMHLVGSSQCYQHRPSLTTQAYGHDSWAFISENFIPNSLKTAYDTLAKDLLLEIEAAFQRAGDIKHIRVHGDCHGGNILWRDNTPHFVDFDDSRMAPAIQDIWMLLTGDDRQQQQIQLSEVLEGYQAFCDFDARELHLIEALRTLRMMHYAAWIARRWQDPAFPHSFSWFNTERYWGEHLLQLREQLSGMREPVLRLL